MALSCCKKLSALLKGITSKHKGDFYCLNCFHSYSTKENLKKHKNLCENHGYWYLEMPKEVNKILKYNHGDKSMKGPFTIYVDLESLPEKINTCHNNPEKSSTTKINQHTASGYSLFTCSSFDTTENKPDCDRGKDCMKEFCKVLKKHVTRIINYEKKKKWYPKQEKKRKCIISKKSVIYVKEKKIVLMIIIKNIINSETIVIILKNIEELLMIFTI